MQPGQVVRVKIQKPEHWNPLAVAAFNGKVGTVRSQTEMGPPDSFWVSFFEPAQSWEDHHRIWNTLLLGPFEGQDKIHEWPFFVTDLEVCDESGCP